MVNINEMSFCYLSCVVRGFLVSSAGKESACNAGDLASIPELGRSPGEGKGYPLQYTGLENPMDCIARGVANSRIWVSDFHFTYTLTKPFKKDSFFSTLLQSCLQPWRFAFFIHFQRLLWFTPPHRGTQVPLGIVIALQSTWHSWRREWRRQT